MIWIKLSLIIIIAIVVFMFLAETTITLKPFSIHCDSLMKAIGVALIFSGVIILNEYHYKKGVKDSIKTTTETTSEFFDELIKEQIK